jgi:glutamate/tyrosine decarboxylase-like PLP-dependent enzyme
VPVYHGGAEHLQLLSDVYALYSQSNPLHADVWPSTSKYEAEIISMTAGLLGAASASPEAPSRVCGSVTSGGTESILLAMKAYRDRARAERNIVRPEIVVPETAHAAFDKAAEYFGIRRVNVPVGADLRADVAAMQAAISDQTIALVASAPSFPHGVIDPVAELGALACARRIGLHVDACLGAFLLPFARELGYPVPPFDFRVRGVTSMSADTHKYGYAAKGTSVVLYGDPELRRYQYFVATDWPGGLYFSPRSPAAAPARSAPLVGRRWSTSVTDGYLDAARRILETAARIRAGVQRIAGLRLLGDSLWIITFGADGFDIYGVLDAMSRAAGA